MDETDLVVRRRLIQKMKLDVFAAARAVEPTEAELADYLQRHVGRFTQPARVRLSHVFLSRDRRGASLDADAEALLARLRARRRRGRAERAISATRSCFRGTCRRAPSASSRRSSAPSSPHAPRRFRPGSGRGRSPPPTGCISYGSTSRAPATLSRLDAVRSEVREALLAERGERALREVVRALRDRHPVRVEGTDEPGSGRG